MNRSENSLRGHPMYRDSEGAWRFCDNNELTSETCDTRPCGICGEYGQPDPCLGQLPGVVNACCGHGNPKEAFICFENGVVVRGFEVSNVKK